MRDKGVLSTEAVTRARKTFAPSDTKVTERAEQQARKTGRLDPLVDPAGYGVIRRSLPRFEKSGEFWEMVVGPPIPIETRLDTTGSMGNNVDIAMQALTRVAELFPLVLPGYDPQIAQGIFGDVQDNFVLCRPQFEMEADNIVKQLTLMVPERDGGDTPEDPHYGLFAGAYLTDSWLNRFGLLGYDFTVSDAEARDRLDKKTLIRVFGEDVFQIAAANGHQIDSLNLPTTAEVVRDLLKRAHAFFLQVGERDYTTTFWTRVFGQNRVVVLPSTEVLPQVQAAIIGLTEGTLTLSGVSDFLIQQQVKPSDAERIVRSVANIPIGAQKALPMFSQLPNAGDLFREKTDLQPINREEVSSKPIVPDKPKVGGVTWL